ncbi:MAG: trimethylamine methyltransferase family protein, partial [Dehalococcoidia bacterium]|nr:trimethylamine methyltransferase family protein [Dehalococcoidia bacterium]
IHFTSPQFHLLSDKQMEELHLATLQVLEKTGVAFDCQEAVDILGEAGADVSDPQRVKIPSYLVEQALRTTPKTITLYTREGEPAMVLDGMTGSHFGAVCDSRDYLDPYTRQRRPCYVEDVADTARLIDALPNIEWLFTLGNYLTLPGAVADKVSLLQVVLNSSKPVVSCLNGVSSLREVLKVCSMVAGGEKELRAKPFFAGISSPVSPLVQGKDAMEESLLCAEKGIPNVVIGAPMAGATTPATLPGALVIGSAECLSQLVVLQLKRPGTPIIFGSLPTIMDMKTTIFSYAAPEMSLIVAGLTEMSRYYKLPMFGTAGCTDADVIGAQAGVEITYQILTTVLSGADLVHDAGLAYHGSMVSPELIVLTDEVVEMVKIMMGGLEINDETLPLDLIERVGPRGDYLSQAHTLKHFRKFWVPTVFDRSLVKGEGVKNCEELLNEKTLKILETYKPKPLSEDLVKELKKIEGTWFKQVGLEHVYPKRG